MIEITNENFSLYFRDAAKNKKQEGDLTVSYRSVTELPDCELKRDVIRLLTETNGVVFAVEALCRHAASSKQDAIGLCTQISIELLKNFDVDKIARKNHLYEMVLFFYVKAEYFPQVWLEDTHWSIVPDENNKSSDK